MIPKSPFTFEYNDYPLIPIKFFYNGKETPLIDALLDSGGDFIVIPMAIARYLGVRLLKGSPVDTAGGTTSLFKANIDLVICNKEQKCTYANLEIHISTRNDIPVLLGRYPIFEDYEITFKKHKNQLLLNPVNPS